MSRQKRVHERLEIRPPPLRQRIANLPIVVHALPAKLRSHRREPLIQPFLEPVFFLVFMVQVVAWSVSISFNHTLDYGTGSVQFEERIRNLKHQDMRMVMLVTHQHALTRPPHPVLPIVLFQPLQPRKYRRVFLGLRLFRPECVVR